MEQLQKMLARLTKNERRLVFRALERLDRGETSKIDIVRLRGSTNMYRVRIGSLRLIAEKRGRTFHARYLFRRSEETYRNL